LEYDNWPIFPAGLLVLKFDEYCANQKLAKLMNSPAFDTIESLERIYFDEEFATQTKIFPKLRHVSIDLRFGEARCRESCDNLISFLTEKIPLLDSLGLYFRSFQGIVDILFSIPQLVSILQRLKKLDIYFVNQSTNLNFLNILRACQNTEFFMADFCLFGGEDLLSFLVDMSGNIKHFTCYFRQRVNVSDLDALRQLCTSHEIILCVYDDDYDYSELNIQNVTEEDRQKQVTDMKIRKIA